MNMGGDSYSRNYTVCDLLELSHPAQVSGLVRSQDLSGQWVTDLKLPRIKRPPLLSAVSHNVVYTEH